MGGARWANVTLVVVGLTLVHSGFLLYLIGSTISHVSFYGDRHYLGFLSARGDVALALWIVYYSAEVLALVFLITGLTCKNRGASVASAVIFSCLGTVSFVQAAVMVHRFNSIVFCFYLVSLVTGALVASVLAHAIKHKTHMSSVAPVTAVYFIQPAAYPPFDPAHNLVDRSKRPPPYAQVAHAPIVIPPNQPLTC